ncbi:MAG: hypothetical protein IJ048_13705 [Clostridia bacterium]|nr:hypothetical protein [Clostridia bacterium]
MEEHDITPKRPGQALPKLLILVIAAILSATLLRSVFVNPATYKNSMRYLDDKMSTATTLTVGTTSASLVVSLLPEDIGSSIADEMAEFSGYLLIVVSAIFLERYLMTTLGFVATTIIFPISALFAGLAALSPAETKARFREYATRLLIFGICLLAIIPLGCLCGRAIEEANSASIQMALEATKEAEEIVEEIPEDGKNIFEQVGDFFGGLWSNATEGYEWAKTALSNFMSAIAVMLVTTIAIPILILFCFVWLVKFLTKRDFVVAIINSVNSFAQTTKRRIRASGRKTNRNLKA